MAEGILQSPNFAGLAQAGFEAGRARARQERLDSALSGVDLERPETIMPVIAADPQTGSTLFQLHGNVVAQRNKARALELAPKVASGNAAALNELWGIDAGLASQMNDDHIKHVDAGVKAAGQAALQIATLPANERAGAWDAAIDALDETYPGLAQFKGQYSETNLRTVLSQAGLGKEYIDLTKPSYQAIAPGGTLGQTNAYAGAIYGQGGGDPASTGQPVRVADQAGYAALAPGTAYIAPDGSHRVKGGAPSQGGASFR